MLKRSWKIKVGTVQLRQMAAEIDVLYQAHIRDGFELTSASGLWRTRANGFTARFVYRQREAPAQDRITHTTVIRGI